MSHEATDDSFLSRTRRQPAERVVPRDAHQRRHGGVPARRVQRRRRGRDQRPRQRQPRRGDRLVRDRRVAAQHLQGLRDRSSAAQ